MADETTQVEGGNGTTAEAPSADDTAASVQAARDLLVAQGHQVLDSSQFHGIKSEAKAKAEAEAAELASKLESIQAENARLAEYKAKQENQGKSNEELYREREAAWRNSDKEKDAAIQAKAAELEAAKEALGRERVQNRIRGLMADTHTPEMALMWADKHVGKFLSTDDSGQLVWTDPTGVPHVGVAAEKLFNEWWQSDAQKTLRTGNPPGPSTSGAPTTPTPTAPKRPEKQPGEGRVAYLMRLEDWQKQNGA